MKDVFLFSINAIMPIIVLVAIGYFIKRIGFGNEEFYKTANSMVFRFFLPVMLFHNVYEIDSLGSINWRLVIYFCLAVLVITGIGLLVAKLVSGNRERIPVIAQCAYRSNHAVIGLPLAEGIGGEAAVSFAAVISAVAIPLFNVLAVLILSAYSAKKKKNKIKEIVLTTIKNPLIIGCFAGIAVLAVRHFMPVDEFGSPEFLLKRDIPFFDDVVSAIARACSPFALIVLGARTDFSAVKSLAPYITTGVLLRLVAAPLIGIGGAYLLSTFTPILSVASTDYPGLVALFGSPVAVASAVMVSEIGGDEQLAMQLVVWTSAFSVLTIFLTVFVLRSFALV